MTVLKSHLGGVLPAARVRGPAGPPTRGPRPARGPFTAHGAAGAGFQRLRLYFYTGWVEITKYLKTDKKLWVGFWWCIYTSTRFRKDYKSLSHVETDTKTHVIRILKSMDMYGSKLNHCMSSIRTEIRPVSIIRILVVIIKLFTFSLGCQSDV